MKEIIINDKYLRDNEMDFLVIRVKGLIINSLGELLIAHNNGTYQFPGGHVEENEKLNVCLQREIKEETGIDIGLDNKAFMMIKTFDDNYFNTGKKVINKIYYFIIRSDEMPNFAETHYDELESQTDFDLFYIKLDKLQDFLNESVDNGSLDKKIGREMLLVLNEYNEINGGM